MSSLISPDQATIQQWLDQSDSDYYLCNQCEGLHLSALQDADGVVDSRLFLERYGLLLTTELEVRPMALLTVVADLGRLNMDYPTLKIFLDVVDDATPQLVVAGVLPATAGVAHEQFDAYIAVTIEAVSALATECLQLDYLFSGTLQSQAPGSTSLH